MHPIGIVVKVRALCNAVEVAEAEGGRESVERAVYVGDR
jgi:hypothetical protein